MLMTFIVISNTILIFEEKNGEKSEILHKTENKLNSEKMKFSIPLRFLKKLTLRSRKN